MYLKLKLGQNSTLRSSLLMSFLPFLVLSLLIVTVWFIASTWDGAHRTARRWARTGASKFAVELTEIAEESGLAKIVVRHQLEHREKLSLPASYLVFEIIASKVELLSGQSWSEVDTLAANSELLKVKEAGLYSAGKFIAFGERFSAEYPNGKAKEIVLLKLIDNAFAKRLSETINAEVSVYRVDESGLPFISATSWQNRAGETILPKLPLETKHQLLTSQDDVVIEGRGRYLVPNYRGRLNGAKRDRGFHEGETEIPGFHAFKPILNNEGKRVGFFSVIVPEAILLEAAGRSATGALLLSLGISILGGWYIVRRSYVIATPIADSTKRLSILIDSLENRYSAFREGSQIARAPHVDNELRTLEFTVEQLKRELAVAERIESALELERNRSIFSAKMATLGELAASVAHEINNPAAVIHAIADELKEDSERGRLSESSVQQKSQIIKDTALRIATITRSLLKLSRDGSAEVASKHRVKDIIDESVILFREQFLKKNIDVKVSLSNEAVTGMFKGIQLSQVFINLLNNAIDAVNDLDEKWIKIDVYDHKQSLIITFTDSGTGIDPTVKTTLMEPFVTTKAPEKGTGLGLSISKHIIEEHGGALTLDSNSPNTKFVVTLPKGDGSKTPTVVL